MFRMVNSFKYIFLIWYADDLCAKRAYWDRGRLAGCSPVPEQLSSCSNFIPRRQLYPVLPSRSNLVCKTDISGAGKMPALPVIAGEIETTFIYYNDHAGK
jgi:hypothetical protein